MHAWFGMRSSLCLPTNTSDVNKDKRTEDGQSRMDPNLMVVNLRGADGLVEGCERFESLICKSICHSVFSNPANLAPALVASGTMFPPPEVS